MLPLLLLIVASAAVQGQRQVRTTQGFRHRGFVPQEAVRYVPGREYSQQQPRAREVNHSFRPSPQWNEESASPVKNVNKRQKPWDDDSGEESSASQEEQWPRETTAQEGGRLSRHSSYDSLPHRYNSKPYTTPIPIIRLDKQQSLDGSYKTSYETGNSIVHEETGFMKQNGGPEENMLVQQGSYSYTDEDGNVFTVRYTADDQGFRAHGDHFPTPPPIPPEIQRGLEMIYKQIRIDAERKLQDQNYDGQNNLDYSGQYSSPVEQRAQFRNGNQQTRTNRFRNNNTNREQTHRFGPNNYTDKEQTRHFGRNNLPADGAERHERSRERDARSGERDPWSGGRDERSGERDERSGERDERSGERDGRSLYEEHYYRGPAYRYQPAHRTLPSDGHLH